MNLEENLKDAQDPQKPPERPRYTIRDAAFALEPQPPLDWVVERLITRGSVSVFYGEPGSKKTYSLLSLAVCAAAGKTWLDFTVNPTPVLIIDEESGERRLTLRLAAALRGEVAGPETPINFISLAQLKLNDPGDQALLQALIEETHAGLVIIDALADVMDGDENSKQDTQPVFSAIRKIAEATTAAIILVHHSNKTGGYRGSSAIKGSVDLMAQIESENGSNWIHFKSEKNRDGEAVDWVAVATWTETQFYLSRAEITEKKKILSKSETYVIGYLTKNGASPLPDIKASADICSPRAAEKAVYSLASRGLVERTNPNEKGQGVVAIYDLANKETQAESEDDH